MENGGDQVSGDDEKYIDPDVAAMDQVSPNVKTKNRKDRDPPQSIYVSPIRYFAFPHALANVDRRTVAGQPAVLILA